jgi:hypothetical protein
LHFHSEGLENIFHFAICGCTIIGNGFTKVDIHVATQKTTYTGVLKSDLRGSAFG